MNCIYCDEQIEESYMLDICVCRDCAREVTSDLAIADHYGENQSYEYEDPCECYTDAWGCE